MVWIDYVIVIIIGFSCLFSWIRGFIYEILSLVIWVCAFFIASHYYNHLSIQFTSFEDKLTRNTIAIVALFMAVLIVGTIVNLIINRLVEKIGLSGINRMLGVVCIGILRGVLIVAIILSFLDTFTEYSKSEDWQRSRLIPHFKLIIRWIFGYLQSFLPKM